MRAEAPVAAPRIEADLRLEGDRVRGTIRNASAQPLSKPAVVLGTAVVVLPDLAPGASATVDLRAQPDAFGRALSERIFGQQQFTSDGRPTGDFLRDQVRRQLVDALTYDPFFGSNGTLPADSPVLLAWGKPGLFAVTVAGERAADRRRDALLPPARPRGIRARDLHAGPHALVARRGEGPVLQQGPVQPHDRRRLGDPRLPAHPGGRPPRANAPGHRREHGRHGSAQGRGRPRQRGGAGAPGHRARGHAGAVGLARDRCSGPAAQADPAARGAGPAPVRALRSRGGRLARGHAGERARSSTSAGRPASSTRRPGPSSCASRTIARTRSACSSPSSSKGGWSDRHRLRPRARQALQRHAGPRRPGPRGRGRRDLRPRRAQRGGQDDDAPDPGHAARPDGRRCRGGRGLDPRQPRRRAPRPSATCRTASASTTT